MNLEFFEFSLRKLVIAKTFGIPLLIADYAFDVFSYIQLGTALKIILLIIGSYLLGCTVDYLIYKSR
ncbi:MAG: hypothetical protein HYS62_01570 [Candidatus Aenigmarchaeota archaeon]|nr:hypothetical protein [Candidatus Aenigmarchaeota archaeon]